MTSLQVPVPRPQRGVLPKASVFRCPADLSVDSWRNKLEDCWMITSSEFQLDEVVDDPSISIQDKWDTFLDVVKHTFFAAESPPKKKVGHFKHKGVIASVQLENLPASGPFTCMKERKLRRRLARWYELGRLRSRHFTEELSAAHTKELRQLCVKLTGSDEIPSRNTIQTQISHFTGLLQQVELKSREENLSNWKRRVHSCSSHLSKWIKSKTECFCGSVVNAQGSPSNTWHGRGCLHF